MTRLPHENRDVVGLSGDKYPRYEVSYLCCVPGCSKLASEKHHLYRRSFLAGDYAWVRLWDGTIVGNLVGLCSAHHLLITDNKAIIEWWDVDSTVSEFVYHGLTSGALTPQPPRLGEKIEQKGVTSHTHKHRDTCPTCHRALSRPQKPTEKARNRATWSIHVPSDERENGTEVLDTLLEECRKILDRPEDKKVRYFVLVESLALIVQNQELLRKDER